MGVEESSASDGPLAALREQLQRLHRQAGEPSTRELAERLDRRLSHDTVHRALRARTLPKWSTVEALVVALDGDPDTFSGLWADAREATSGPTRETGARRRPVVNKGFGSGLEQGLRLGDGHARQDGFWEDLSLDDRFMLQARGRRRGFWAEDLLVSEGTPLNSVFVLLRGFVKLTKSSEFGFETIVRLGAPGDLLLEDALSDRPAGAAIRALTAGELLILDRDAVLDLLAGNRRIVVALTAALASKVAAADLRRVWAASGALPRVCEELLQMAASYGRPSYGGGVEFPFPFSQRDMAGLCDLSLRTCARVLEDLRNRQIIGVSRRRLRILRTSDLRDIARRVKV
ncbi:Crp/Fnr family transcriptional regulator [Kitasatospora sp. NPDC059408]|uniref:Crp/Fnr family transcriptional regulator n=1 Tax=Kitasatospora sp. NPDC059408 TaxID=3346823 RepID=UPI00367642D4